VLGSDRGLHTKPVWLVGGPTGNGGLLGGDGGGGAGGGYRSAAAPSAERTNGGVATLDPLVHGKQPTSDSSSSVNSDHIMQTIDESPLHATRSLGSETADTNVDGIGALKCARLITSLAYPKNAFQICSWTLFRAAW
jgi:hypothetical protein